MKDFKINPFEKFDKEWALLTAGDKEKFNSMTISWGSMGTLWFKDVVTIYIRPERYTYEFIEKNENFTISFYDEKYKNELTFFGRNTGRNVDKVKETGFTPIVKENYITYEEAKETLVLKKLYIQQMDKTKFSEDILKFYEEGSNPHYIIIGEVINYIKK